VFVYQVYIWLRHGKWIKMSLQKALLLIAGFLPKNSLHEFLSQWQGLKKLVGLCLTAAGYVPLSALLILISIFIMVYFDDDLKMRE
jgi:hypothetical protein